MRSKLKIPESREEIISAILRAREGSVDSLDSLKTKYLPLIESQVSKYCSDYMSMQDRSDLHEEALSAFFDAICSFNCDGEGIEFGLYAKICISNRLITFLRKYRTHESVASLDNMQVGIPQGERTDPLQLVIEKENVQTLVGTIQQNLSSYEASIWWLYTAGFDAKTIAEKVNAPDVRSVNNAIYRIRKKLRSLLSD